MHNNEPTGAVELYNYNNQKIISYAKSHHAHMSKCFQQLKENETSTRIKIDKVFTYLKEAFSQDGFQFKDGISGDSMLNQTNTSNIDSLLERFYLTVKQIPKDQFFFYRLSISEDQLADLIEYWIKTDAKLFIEYPHEEEQTDNVLVNQKSTKVEGSKNIAQPTNLPTSQSNQFIGGEDTVEKMIKDLLEEIHNKELLLAKSNSESQRTQLQNNIKKLKNEVTVLEQSNKKPHKLEGINTRKDTEANSTDFSPPKSSYSYVDTPERRKLNLRILFDYYRKENHISGIKSTFDRIQHESTTVNYPKLVHMLKDFGFLNDKSKIDIFHMFQKAAADYKSLQFNQFQLFLTELSHIMITDDIPNNQKENRFFGKMFEEGKNLRVSFLKQPKDSPAGKPFHTRQSNAFRIDPEQLKYKFHIMPHSGKTVQEIQQELVKRRQDKQQHKIDLIKKKQAQKQRFLKKLSSIDPYNMNLVGLKENHSREEKVAAINNLEVFRDASFNPKEYFKINQDADDDAFMSEYSINNSFTKKKENKSLSRQQTNQSALGYPSPRKDRAKSIVQQVSHRAVQLQKMQNSKNQALLKSIASSSTSPQKKHALGKDTQKRRY